MYAVAVRDDVVFHQKPLPTIKSWANGETKQLPDIINGKNLLGYSQMLLNGKHLVDIFI